MAAPPKPWESSGNQNLIFQQSRLPQGVRMSTSPMYSAQNVSTTVPQPPPSVPVNSRMQSSYGYPNYRNTGYSGLGSYSPYGVSSYGYGSPYSNYGSPYSSYGSYGSPYSSYNMMRYGSYGQMPFGQNQYGFESRFIQAAEESSRPAFESLESLVHAFGSISMMMESTFFAIQSSFRAVLGVAENFGRMRGLLAQVFSALTIFKAVRWAIIKMLQFLRLRKPGEAEKVWAEVAATSDIKTGGQGSAWPIVMFMSLIMGGPYLIWKILHSVKSSLGESSNPAQSNSQEAQKVEPWMLGKPPCYLGQATFGFQARQSNELTFNAGDVLTMAPSNQQTFKNQGWVLATKLRDASGTVVSKPSPVGLVPLNHFNQIHVKNSANTNIPENFVQPPATTIPTMFNPAPPSVTEKPGGEQLSEDKHPPVTTETQPEQLPSSCNSLLSSEKINVPDMTTGNATSSNMPENSTQN